MEDIFQLDVQIATDLLCALGSVVGAIVKILVRKNKLLGQIDADAATFCAYLHGGLIEETHESIAINSVNRNAAIRR